MKNKAMLILALLLLTPIVMAVDFNEQISAEDKAAFDEILEPVMKVYNFVKYVASVMAVIVILFAGVSYMLSGSDPRKREQAKNMIMYTLVGLFVIWMAPLIVNFIIG